MLMNQMKKAKKMNQKMINKRKRKRMKKNKNKKKMKSKVDTMAYSHESNPNNSW